MESYPQQVHQYELKVLIGTEGCEIHVEYVSVIYIIFVESNQFSGNNKKLCLYL